MNTPKQPVAQCFECALVPGHVYHCPSCHALVSATNSGVYVDHDVGYAWDNKSCTWRKYKVSPGHCVASGGNFVWLDYHECADWWESEYQGVVI
jgi:hypothetical protein